MAPKKKNENNTASALKKPKQKVAKAPVKNKLKPKCSLKNPKNCSVNTMLTAIDRMNEVARAQLVKDSSVVVTTEIAPTVLKKKRGRKKKLDEPETPENVPKKKLKKTATAQVRAKNTNKSKVVPPKQKTPPKKRGRPPIRRKLQKAEDSAITSPSILSGFFDTKTSVKDSQNPVLKPSVDSTVNNGDSRRTSVASASELSWFRDISGSSTTTCITVNSTTQHNLVLMDGKLPELKLNKIDQVLKEHVQTTTETSVTEHSFSEDSSSSTSSSSSSSSSSSGSSNENTAVENALNLSTSSISHIPHSPTYTTVDQSFNKNKPAIDEVTLILENLAPKLESLDLSFPDIENESENFDTSPFVEKISMFLNEENDTILECNFLSQILSENASKTHAPENQQKPTEETDFAKPDLTMLFNKSLCDNRNDVSSGITRRRDTYDPCDDDDALSLFAESIGMDSSRVSSVASISCVAPHEEYVPQPLFKRPYIAVNYQPTVTSEPKVNQIEAAKTKPVCEKQNADSTSIHKEPELNCTSNDNFAPVNKTAQKQDSKQVNYTATGDDRPLLTISCYKHPASARSVTLQGVCFFNLINSCTKMDMCPYSHRLIEEQEFRARLATLSEEQFIQEYSHIGRWPRLRRKYVKCFADECQRRELPKILVEIVIDSLSKFQRNSEEDAFIKIKLIESTLSYLNSWDLSVCEQLLTYNVGGEVLCDLFMKIMANTQNFSRFKNVFMNLADFMVRVNRTFELEVVSHILERVCILPFEAPLAARLISIMERTDRNIFSYHLMNWFEMMLNNFNKELCNRLLSIKMGSVMSAGPKPINEVSSPSLPSPCGSRGSRELEPLIINKNSAQDHDHRYTSPDTTNTDNMNKPVNEPVIIRTLSHLNPIRPVRMPMQGPGPHNMFPRRWNQRSIMSQMPRIPYMRPQRRPMGRPGPSLRPQFNFQRRYPPDFYGPGS